MSDNYKMYDDFPHYVTVGAEDPKLMESVFQYALSITDDKVDIFKGDYVISAFGGITSEDASENPKKTGLSFEEALYAMKNGKFVRLPFWSPEVRIGVQYPDEFSKMTHPYLYVTSRKGCVPWKETYPELFSNDWEIYENPEQK